MLEIWDCVGGRCGRIPILDFQSNILASAEANDKSPSVKAACSGRLTNNGPGARVQ